jgi:hypothetical protein
MILLFENLLKQVINPLVPVERIHFTPPDSTWRQFASGQDAEGERLNIYHVEVCENRKLRSSVPHETPRLDCHYVISAWRHIEDILEGMLTPSYTEYESKLLYKSAAKILDVSPMIPANILGSEGQARNDGWHEKLLHYEIPITLAPPEGFPKLPEFWGAMGEGFRWKPVLHLVATLPVILPEPDEAHPVTTISSDYGDENQVLENLIIIGGIVKVDDVVTASVIVSLLLNGKRIRQTITNKSGRFSLGTLTADSYVLRAELDSRISEREIEVPSPFGNYDIEINY